jgi:hypothetical protein
MTEYSVYFVINRNPLTLCPDGWNKKTWRPYAGPYLQSNGYQVSTLSQAKMYWTKAGADKLCDYMNTAGVKGRNYHIGSRFTDTPEEKGVYEVMTATLTLPSQ